VGCTAVVDAFFQKTLRVAPESPRPEYSVLEILETLCDDFVYYTAQNVDGYVFYQPPRVAVPENDDGKALKSYCQIFVEEYDELLIEYGLKMNKGSSASIQTDICVDKVKRCEAEKLKEMARAIMANIEQLRKGGMPDSMPKGQNSEAPAKKKAKKQKKSKKAKREL
jgi:hypothetical protein